MNAIIVGVLCFTLASYGFSFKINPNCVKRTNRISFRPRTRFCTTLNTSPTASAETFSFESNVTRVMDIIINSLYSNKDVFVRELISNAADACDKKRHLSIANANSNMTFDKLSIKISADRDKNTLTIEDNGVGMTKEELIRNLGRIAESGTKKFSESLADAKDGSNLIGQFGVGFYSAFLVADKVDVVTKSFGVEQLLWSAESSNLNKYTVVADDGDPIENTGTRVILHLKSDCDQYADDNTLKTLIGKYSEFIPFPIELRRNVTKPESVPDPSKPVGEDGTIPMKMVMNKVVEWAVINDKKPLWLRSPKDCTPTDYTEFYQQTFKAYDVPLAHAHFSVEGSVNFKSLLYIPTQVPYELMRDMFASAARSMRLYVKRVFINDKFEDLIPRWLIFLRGVVDSDDFQLNVSREILQQSRSLRLIKMRLVKKTIDMLIDLSNTNQTAYSLFFKNFGRYLKVGIIEDEKHRADLIPLCRFYSSFNNTSDPEGLTSLPEYVSRMKSDQKSIYYVVGESKSQAAMSPTLERLKQQGYEVLYVTEAIDEMTLQHIDKFAEKSIIDTGKEASQELSPEEKKEKSIVDENFESLRMWLKQVLGDKVTRVEVSSRLVDSPATLVQSEYGLSPNMQKYLKSQAVAEGPDTAGHLQNVFNQAVLEINPSHPIVQHLKRLTEKDAKSPHARDIAVLLHCNAALAAGYILDNSVEYSQLVTKLLSNIAHD